MLSSVFYGPPGCGKTALAKIIARRTKSEFIRLNAVTAKTDDLRASLKTAQQNRLIGNSTLLFIDEIHRFNKMVQDGLLPALEEDLVTLIGTTTKNPFFYLIPPLRSRILLFEFEKLSQNALGLILKQAERREGFTLEEKARDYLIQFSNGDARRMFNLLQTALVLSELSNVTVDDLEKIIQRQQVLYDRDEDYHFDIISAYIKSIRGSDPDASLHWLSLMLEGGEDPLYIARRLIVLASEDIGLADSFSLVLAVAAYDAVDMIGMPEARIILSHVTLYLALQPKSNSSYLAISKALEYVKTKETGDVPDYLKSSHPAVKNYRYPHDFKYHYVVQEYMKERLRFYEPGILGQEREMKKRLDFLKNLRKEEHNDQQEGDS
jgi:putative ATPase